MLWMMTPQIARNLPILSWFFLDSSGQICYYFVKVDYDGAQFEDSARLTRNVILETILKEILYSIS